MTRTQIAWLALALAGLVPTVASAEVMDKEPSLRGLWQSAILLGLVGLLAWRWNRLLGIVVTAVVLPLVWSFHWELTDPFVGHDIRLEAGESYVRQAYLSMLLCTVLHVLGILGYFLRWRLASSRKTASARTRAVEQ